MELQPITYPDYKVQDQDTTFIDDSELRAEFYHYDYQELVLHLGTEEAEAKAKMYLALSQQYSNCKSFVIHDCQLLRSYSGISNSMPVVSTLLDRKCSVFYAPIKNTTKQRQLTIREVCTLIRSNTFQSETEQFRSIIDEDERKSFKTTNFCYATFSGTFSQRADKHLIEHSNLICIDFDHLGTKLQTTRKKIEENPSTVICFISPSGDGLKVLFEMDPGAYSQAAYYTAYSNHLARLCELPKENIDKSCKDISRACFLPYDPNLYINPHFE